MSDSEVDEDWAGYVDSEFQDFNYDEPEHVEIVSHGSEEVETPENEDGWEDYEGSGNYGEGYGEEQEAPMPPPPAPPPRHQQPSIHTSGIPARIWETLNAEGYSVLSILGKGSFATVMRAKAANLGGKEVAIKDILKSCPPGASQHQVASQQQYLQHFLPRELSVIKNLKHEHIVGFYAVLETSNHMFVAMELAANGTVEGLVNDKYKRLGRGVSEYVAGCWFWQTLLGLQYCHERGIAHRDLKPENLLLNNQFYIKIIDFGFAKTNITKGEVSETYCGSMSWACIEILKNIPYDPRLADVWAMGLILYFMVYGFNPFRTDSLPNLVADALKPVQFPTAPSVHHSFQDIIHDRMVVSQLQRKYLEELFRFDPYIIHIKTEMKKRNPDSVLDFPVVPTDNSLVRDEDSRRSCPSPAGGPSKQPSISRLPRTRPEPVPDFWENEPTQPNPGPSTRRGSVSSRAQRRKSRDEGSSRSQRRRSSRTDSHSRNSSRRGSRSH